jgi:hypothetical protein
MVLVCEDGREMNVKWCGPGILRSSVARVRSASFFRVQNPVCLVVARVPDNPRAHSRAPAAAF